MTGLGVNIGNHTFLESTHPDLLISRTPQDFFRILNQIQLAQEHHMILICLSTSTTYVHFVQHLGACD